MLDRLDPRGTARRGNAGPARPHARPLAALRTRSSTSCRSGRWVSMKPTFRAMFAPLSWLHAITSTSAGTRRQPAGSSGSLDGNPAQCFTRRNRSSSTAATTGLAQAQADASREKR